jgi:hypothetical protein
MQIAAAKIIAQYWLRYVNSRRYLTVPRAFWPYVAGTHAEASFLSFVFAALKLASCCGCLQMAKGRKWPLRMLLDRIAQLYTAALRNNVHVSWSSSHPCCQLNLLWLRRLCLTTRARRRSGTRCIPSRSSASPASWR